MSLGDGQGIPVFQPAVTTAISAGGSVAAAGLFSSAGFAMSSLAVPLIGAAIAGVTLAIGLWLNRLGPKQKVATTKIVNEAEPLLKQNLDAWNASSKTPEEQAQAIANFQNIWSAVVQACSVDQYGSPGHACIEDRMPQGQQIQAGGNTYTGNGKWNWFGYYLDPIQNDPNVRSASIGSSASSLLSSFTSGSGLSGGALLAIAVGLVLVGGWAMMED